MTTAPTAPLITNEARRAKANVATFDEALVAARSVVSVELPEKPT